MARNPVSPSQSPCCHHCPPEPLTTLVLLRDEALSGLRVLGPPKPLLCRKEVVRRAGVQGDHGGQDGTAVALRGCHC